MDNSFAGANEIKGDERMLGLFAHLSLFLGGILVPIIFWATNKDKSKFVTFHSLQALWFHIAYIIVIVVVVMVLVIAGAGFGLLSAGMHGTGGKSAGGAIFIIALIAFYGFLFLSIFGAMGYSIYMGVKAYHGELKKYPIIGNMVYKKVYGH
jgi:uncharacterized Tic20 family protein